jgi:hypothetical protein
MLYIKPDEVNTWAPRTPVDDEGLTSMALVASAMAESYIGRSLAIGPYRQVINLGAGLAGYVGPIPITEVSLVRIRRARRLVGGGKAASAEGWFELGEDEISNLIDFSTGRVELYSFQWDGYQRFEHSRMSPQNCYQAEITFRAGFIPATEIIAAADAGSEFIEVLSTGDITSGTLLTVGPYSKLYTVDRVVGSRITLTEGIENEVVVGDEVAGKVPSDVRADCGAIIEDLQTWTPNSESMSNTLSIIKETTKRTSSHPIPPAAAALLSRYKRWSWA